MGSSLRHRLGHFWKGVVRCRPETGNVLRHGITRSIRGIETECPRVTEQPTNDSSKIEALRGRTVTNCRISRDSKVKGATRKTKNTQKLTSAHSNSTHTLARRERVGQGYAEVTLSPAPESRHGEFGKLQENMYIVFLPVTSDKKFFSRRLQEFKKCQQKIRKFPPGDQSTVDPTQMNGDRQENRTREAGMHALEEYTRPRRALPRQHHTKTQNSNVRQGLV